MTPKGHFEINWPLPFNCEELKQITAAGSRHFIYLILQTSLLQTDEKNQEIEDVWKLKVEFVSISRVINHMTSYNSSALIGWNYSIQTGEQIL